MRPSNIKKYITSIEDLLFSEGWAFMAVYAAIYIPSWIFKVPVPYVTHTFEFLHIILLTLATSYYSKKISAYHYQDIFFWVGIFIFFVSVGAYLEYPHDSWEFVRDIFEFQKLDYIHQSFIPHRSTYYWGWTWMGRLPVEWRRPALNVFAAFWDLLLAYQIYLLSIKFEFNNYWSKIQTFAAILILGYCNASQFRMLSLSSTLLNFVFVFRGHILLLDYVETKKMDWKKYFLLLPLICITHFQGLLLLGISSVTLYIYRYHTDRPQKFYKKIKIVSSLLAITSSIVVYKFLLDHPDLWSDTLRHYNHDGFFGLFDWFNSYSQAYGVLGFINLGVAFYYRKKYPVLSLLTWTPVFILITPLTAYLLITPMYNPDTAHRILYMIPYSYFIVIALKEWMGHSNFIYLKKPLPQSLFVIFFLLVLSAPPKRPWFGRLQNLVIQPGPVLELEVLDPLLLWLKKNRHSELKYCKYLSDQVTNFYLGAQLGGGESMFRIIDMRDDPNQSQLTYLNLQYNQPSFCAVFVARSELLPKLPQSLTNHHLHMWTPELADISYFTTDKFHQTAEKLVEKGWIKTEVPPFYYMYENPKRNDMPSRVN